jgi:hypothetical protein
MLAVWYPFEWFQQGGTAWNLSFIVLVTVLFALAVGYLLTHRKKP